MNLIKEINLRIKIGKNGRSTLKNTILMNQFIQNLKDSFKLKKMSILNLFIKI